MQLFLRPFQLHTRHVFTISRGSTSVYSGVLVELEQDGCRGYGEAGESPYYGATVEHIRGDLERLREQIQSWQPGDPAELWQTLDPQLGHNRFAQAALDMAAHDLWGKLLGRPVWDLWGLDPRRSPPSDYTIGIDDPPTMLAKMREFPDWPVYKIKLGGPCDVEVVRQLRPHTGARLCVDANGAWSVEQALQNARALAELGVELIEQPLPADDWSGMRRLRAVSPLPLLADESCPTEADVERCVGHFHGVNVKLVKCGGLTPARRMLQRARQLGLATMIGCMTESSVGISAAAQLLPLVDYADLDGALLLADDIASGVQFQQGRAVFPAVAGCGVEIITSRRD